MFDQLDRDRLPLRIGQRHDFMHFMLARRGWQPAEYREYYLLAPVRGKTQSNDPCSLPISFLE